MKLILEFDEEVLLRDVMQNYPEYSSPSLHCIHWKYKDMEFLFRDTDDGKEYRVDLPMLKVGLGKLLVLLQNNELPGISINLSNFTDTGEWDCDCLDALVQCSIFGKVIYG